MNFLASLLAYCKISIPLCAFAAVAFCQLGFAQTFSSSITGIIHDPSGAVVSGAKVELKNTETNDVRAATSSSDGSYQFQNLDPGTYEVTVQAPGFSSYTKSNMLLRAHTGSSREYRSSGRQH